MIAELRIDDAPTKLHDANARARSFGGAIHNCPPQRHFPAHGTDVDDNAAFLCCGRVADVGPNEDDHREHLNAELLWLPGMDSNHKLDRI
jgi:hypothetical protein